MEAIQRGRLEMIGAILSNQGVFWLVNSLVILFNSLNTGPFEYSIPLSFLTVFAIMGVAVVGPRIRPEWAAFQQGNRMWLMLGVVVAANFAVLLPYHPQFWSAIKYQAFIVLPLYCFCIMYEFFKTKVDVVDDQPDEEASLNK